MNTPFRRERRRQDFALLAPFQLIAARLHALRFHSIRGPHCFPSLLHLAGTALAVLLAAGVAVSYGQTQPTRNADPATLPARDLHQGFLIAADPYLTSERSQQTFGKKHPYGAGLLALEVYLRNDSESPMKVDLNTIELQVAAPGQPRQRIESLTAREAAYLIVLPNGPRLQQRRTPIPGLGSSGGKSKEVDKMEGSLRTQMLPGDVIGPHNTVHGFVLFDVDHHFEWAGNATLYVPDVRRIGSGEKLLFFEVDLGPATR